MKRIKVKREYDGLKVVNCICTYFPNVKPSAVLKALSKKDIKINGMRTKENLRVKENDEIRIYLADEFFDCKKAADSSTDFSTVYKDDNIIVVDKPAGIPVHPGKTTRGGTLVELVRSRFKNPDINLCHRIDMNTSGLVLFAQNKTSLKEISSDFKTGNIIKRYHCLVKGIPGKNPVIECHDGIEMYRAEAYLEKAPGKKRVFIHAQKQSGDLHIITRYRILNIFHGAGPENGDVSEIQVELTTGRTHQIRAHFAYLGNPVLGDSKYGKNEYNRFFKSKSGRLKYQQLFSTYIHFGKRKKSGPLSYLCEKSFTIDPDYEIDFKLNPQP